MSILNVVHETTNAIVMWYDNSVLMTFLGVIVGGFIGLCATIMNYKYTDLDGNNVVVGGFENCSVDGEINGLGGLYGGFVGQSRLYRVSASGRPGFNPVTDRSYDKAVANVDIVASAS